MAILSKKDILKKRALKTEVVEVPEWGGGIIVQEMTALQRDKFEEWVMKREDDSSKGTRVAIFINTVVDESGKQIFNDLDAADLIVKSADIVDRVSSVGLRLSGMSQNKVEEETKNSKPVPKEDSSSDSAAN